MGLEGVGQFLAVDPDLPGEQAVHFDGAAGEFTGGRGVVVGQSGKRELAVVVEAYEAVALVRVFILGLGVGDTLDDVLAVGLEELLHFRRQGVDRFVGDEAVGALAPAEGRRQAEEESGGE